MKKMRTCVLGSTGMVGQQFIRLLDNHPYFDLITTTASNNSVGKVYNEATDWCVEGLFPEYMKNIDIIENNVKTILEHEIEVVFSGLPSSVAGNIETELAREEIFVFSNTAAHRMDKTVPILIPEINPDHLDIIKHQRNGNNGFIITNSNCSVAGIVFGLKPLFNSDIKSVFVTTYQALSGAGRKGLSSMHEGPTVIPYINNEEFKVESETRKILGRIDDKKNKIMDANMNINATCARVPVKNGHLVSIIVHLGEEKVIDEIEAQFSNFLGEPQLLKLPTAPRYPIILHTEDDRPQQLKDLEFNGTSNANGMSVHIGRLRKKGRHLNFFLLVHNTIRGAAGTSVLSAEYAYAKKCLN